MFSATVSSVVFCTLLFLFSFWDSDKMSIRPCDIVPLALFIYLFYHFPLCSSDWIISIALGSSSRTLFFIISILQLRTSREFWVLFWLLYIWVLTFCYTRTHTQISSLCWDSSFFFFQEYSSWFLEAWIFRMNIINILEEKWFLKIEANNL